MTNDFIINDLQIKSTNILVFAYVGDSIHSLFVRSYFAKNLNAKSGKLNALTNKYVCAKGQSLALDSILKILTEEELSIVKTARNTSTHNIAKNASIEAYKKATSFESLLGFLYMKGNESRLKDILYKSFENVKNILN